MAIPSETANQLVAPERGILAADESPTTMSQRLAAVGIDPTETNRNRYREMLVSAPGLDETVSGIILSDETFHSVTSDGRLFVHLCHDLGVLPGIKVDTGTVPLEGGDGALLTTGLNGLNERMADYAAHGATFAKWRAVIDVETVSAHSLETNARALAEYAATCQQHGITPIVEPEVLCTGSHTMNVCASVTERALTAVFDQLDRHGVELDGIVLKPNMVTPGLDGPAGGAVSIAAATLGVLESVVPSAVPGIAFLSGGHSNDQACEYLGAINELAGTAPWELTYSFGRALVSDALRQWATDLTDLEAAQEVLLANCERASAATQRRPVRAA